MSADGFMEGLMNTINATWPHPDHVFLNMGKGGSCLDLIAEGSCLSAYLPEEVDIAVLDTVTNICPRQGSSRRSFYKSCKSCKSCFSFVV